ncbi:MAG: copper chaperone PCu(A)C [Porticoccaceae bacterium]
MRVLTACFLLSMSPLIAAQVGAGGLVVGDPYFRESIPGQSRTAGFFTLTNPGAEDCALAAASAEGIGRLEIHEHSHDNGVMRMRRIDLLAVPAGQTVMLEPGGYHLMGFEVAEPLKAGDSVEVTLDFGACGAQVEHFAVRALEGR